MLEGRALNHWHPSQTSGIRGSHRHLGLGLWSCAWQWYTCGADAVQGVGLGSCAWQWWTCGADAVFWPGATANTLLGGASPYQTVLGTQGRNEQSLRLTCPSGPNPTPKACKPIGSTNAWSSEYKPPSRHQPPAPAAFIPWVAPCGHSGRQHWTPNAASLTSTDVWAPGPGPH